MMEKEKEHGMLTGMISVVTDKVVNVLTEFIQPFLDKVIKRIGDFDQRILNIERHLNVSPGKGFSAMPTVDILAEMKDIYRDFTARTKMLSYVIKEHPEVKGMVSAMDSKFQSAIYRSYHDSLTGLYNRNYLEEVLRDKRGDWVGFCIDIDNFKKINDTHGHGYGDVVLKNVANVVRKTATSSQHDVIVFRLGGEEIGVLWRVRDLTRSKPEDEIAYIQGVAEKIRKNIADYCACTVSIGIADKVTRLPLSKENFDVATVFKNIFGDEYLYAAKHGGKNRVCINTQTLIESLYESLRNINNINTDRPGY
jgi:diguanylate cyclase (GGDEF)-like protein